MYGCNNQNFFREFWNYLLKTHKLQTINNMKLLLNITPYKILWRQQTQRIGGLVADWVGIVFHTSNQLWEKKFLINKNCGTLFIYLLLKLGVFIITEMVEAMKKIAQLDVELTVEERNLLSVAYKNVIGARRASWRILSSIEQKSNDSDNPTKLAEKSRQKVRNMFILLLM